MRKAGLRDGMCGKVAPKAEADAKVPGRLGRVKQH